uniref:Uncharacterized protein n=1 Tax=Caenorhabditis japonica TaxID=281687 RepID=A0A8R1HNG4_CAEJA
MHLLSSIIATVSLASVVQACFCPMMISSPCGCGGGSYGYGGGGYAQSPGYAGSYATFFRDLTPFRQTGYYQQVPAYPQYYPRAPAQSLPPMYRLPNPRYIQPQAPPPPPPPQPPVRPQYVPRPVVAPTLVSQEQIYLQPAATVAPLVAEPVRTTLHDNFYGTQEEITVTTVAPDVPDFVDETPVKGEEKEEVYYVYYDDKGNKVGDSRTGSTFAPDVVVEEEITQAPGPAPVILEVTTQRVQEEANESYDDIVEENPVPVRTSLATTFAPDTRTTVSFVETRAQETTVASPASEVIYEDETVEYADNGEEKAEETVVKKPTSSGGYKRTIEDNQILVDAAENTGEGYMARIAAKGVKIVKRYPYDVRKIHEN